MQDDAEKDGFIARWSRRKEAVRRGEAVAEPLAPVAPADTDTPPSGPATPESAAEVPDEVCAGDAAQRVLTEADFADVDFSALTEASDFTRFLGPRVPDVIRQKALARLWQTDPAFSTADVLHDYAEDFTDAAKAVPGIASSWKFGRGFLSDDEVAAWEALGKPPAEAEASAGEKKGLDQVTEVPRQEGAEPDAPSATSPDAEAPQARADAARVDAGPAKDAAPVAAAPALLREENAKA